MGIGVSTEYKAPETIIRPNVKVWDMWTLISNQYEISGLELRYFDS